ncbi:STAS-like domain-containing protein [bacterium]|nr:STAS-like domain-containing protein [bacterium]
MRMIVQQEVGSSLSSREEGKRLRESILAVLHDHDFVELDFESELVASVSFLDEALARLVEDLPTSDLKKRVRLLNFTEQDRQLLNMLTAARLREKEPLQPGD